MYDNIKNGKTFNLFIDKADAMCETRDYEEKLNSLISVAQSNGFTVVVNPDVYSIRFDFVSN